VSGGGHEPIPLARPVIGAREEELVLDVLRSRHLALGPMLPAFERALGDRVGVEHVAAVSSGTAGLHLALRASGVEAGDEVVTTPFSFVASANSILYEGARPIFCDIDPRTLNIDPAAAAAAVGERGNPAVFAFYPNKQLTTGEGGAVVCPDAAVKQRVDSERNQGRAPDMGWLDHDRLGFNYRLSDVACALGVAQVERLDAMLAARERIAGLYNESLAAVEGLTLPCPDADGDRRSWFVYVVQLPPGVDRDGAIRELRARGIDSKPYLPAIHLMSFYRERFGHREGEFPVCEDVAARSLALPFFPELTDGEVERVVAALTDVLEAAAVRGA
jgi:perosamine synthetase